MERGVDLTLSSEKKGMVGDLVSRALSLLKVLILNDQWQNFGFPLRLPNKWKIYRWN